MGKWRGADRPNRGSERAGDTTRRGWAGVHINNRNTSCIASSLILGLRHDTSQTVQLFQVVLQPAEDYRGLSRARNVKGIL